MIQMIQLLDQFVRDHIPLEQGLRPVWTARHGRHPPSVRDHIPLEQGLRLESVQPVAKLSRVRDHIPLEQGLRLGRLDCNSSCHESETIFH